MVQTHFVQLVLQCLFQPASLPGALVARAPPTLTAFAFGMNFMPAFLDSKSNTIPEHNNGSEGIDLREYYGLESTSTKLGGEKDKSFEDEESQ